MKDIKIINKSVVEKIIADLQKVSKNEHIEEISIEAIQNSPKRAIEKYMNTLSVDEQIDLYALMFLGKELLENGVEADIKLFVKNREYASNLIKQNGFHAHYLTSKTNLSLYFNKSLKIYEILDNNKEFIF